MCSQEASSALEDRSSSHGNTEWKKLHKHKCSWRHHGRGQKAQANLCWQKNWRQAWSWDFRTSSQIHQQKGSQSLICQREIRDSRVLQVYELFPGQTMKPVHSHGSAVCVGCTSKTWMLSSSIPVISVFNNYSRRSLKAINISKVKRSLNAVTIVNPEEPTFQEILGCSHSTWEQNERTWQMRLQNHPNYQSLQNNPHRYFSVNALIWVEFG